jgi:hypothetical protein
MARLDPVLRFLYEGIVADANAEGTRLVPYSTQVIRDDENDCVDVYATTDYVYQTEDGRRLDPPEVERARTMLAKYREQASSVQKKRRSGGPGRKKSPALEAAEQRTIELYLSGDALGKTGKPAISVAAKMAAEESKEHRICASSLERNVSMKRINDHLKKRELQEE